MYGPNRLFPSTHPPATLQYSSSTTAENRLENPQDLKFLSFVGGIVALAGLRLIGSGLYTSLATPRTLNGRLQKAAKTRDDPDICRSLIQQKADPNSTTTYGYTPLQLSISSQHWLTCKALIDNGAEIKPQDEEQIRQYLAQEKASKFSQDLYMRCYPNPGLPYIYENGNFVPLENKTSNAEKSESLTLAIFFICEEEINSNYGSVSKNFSNEFLPLDDLAANYKIVRIRINDKNRFASTVDKILEFLPEHLVGLVVLSCHGNQKTAWISKDSILKCDDHQIMQELGKRMVPFGQIILSGCNQGKTSEGKNIGEIFSENSPTQIVYATTKKCSLMIPFSFRFKSIPTAPPICIPNFYQTFTTGPLTSCTTNAYMKGRTISSGKYQELEKDLKERLFWQIVCRLPAAELQKLIK